MHDPLQVDVYDGVIGRPRPHPRVVDEKLNRLTFEKGVAVGEHFSPIVFVSYIMFAECQIFLGEKRIEPLTTCPDHSFDLLTCMLT